VGCTSGPAAASFVGSPAPVSVKSGEAVSRAVAVLNGGVAEGPVDLICWHEAIRRRINKLAREKKFKRNSNLASCAQSITLYLKFSSLPGLIHLKPIFWKTLELDENFTA